MTLLHTRQFAKRTVRVSKEMTEDAKTLLRLMGVPVIEAPTEAEAQCAALAKAGAVRAAVSEDMDTLTFGAPIMLRNVFGKFTREHAKQQALPPLLFRQSAFVVLTRELCASCSARVAEASYS